jgi:hypothetical protein
MATPVPYALEGGIDFAARAFIVGAWSGRRGPRPFAARRAARASEPSEPP